MDEIVQQGSRRAAAVALLAAVASAVVVAGAAGAATPVQGSVAGPVTAVAGRTFSVKTALSPTGSSKVTLAASTRITEQSRGSRADLRDGVCVSALGAKKGSSVAAARVTVRPAVSGRCETSVPGRRPGGGLAGRPARSGRSGFAPAGFAFAFGQITAVKGSTLTVKGTSATTSVSVSSSTKIEKTASVPASAVAVRLCAFVRGTSSDRGVTVQAADVALSQPVGGTCTGFRPGR